MSNNKTMKSEPITPATQEIVVSGFNPLTLQAAEASLAQKAEILDVNLSLRNWDTSKRQEFERSVYLGCDHYYYQVQMQMWATKTEKALFVAFNPKWVGTDLERKALHIVEIERDEAVIAEMRQAIQEGLLVLEARKRKIVA